MGHIWLSRHPWRDAWAVATLCLRNGCRRELRWTRGYGHLCLQVAWASTWEWHGRVLQGPEVCLFGEPATRFRSSRSIFQHPLQRVMVQIHLPLTLAIGLSFGLQPCRGRSQKTFLDSGQMWGQGFTGHGSWVALGQVTSLSVPRYLTRHMRGKHVTHAPTTQAGGPARDENGGPSFSNEGKRQDSERMTPRGGVTAELALDTWSGLRPSVQPGRCQGGGDPPGGALGVLAGSGHKGLWIGVPLPVSCTHVSSPSPSLPDPCLCKGPFLLEGTQRHSLLGISLSQL